MTSNTARSRRFLALEPDGWDEVIAALPAWLTAQRIEEARLARLFASRRWAMEQAGYRYDDASKGWTK